MTRSDPTLGDVAARAGVSKATASKVFNGRADVAARTRELVTRAAEELGYVPPVRSHPGNGRPQVWVVFDTLANHYAGHVLDGLLDEADSQESLVVISEWGSGGAHLPRPSSPEWIRKSIERGASAFVLITTPVGPEHVKSCGGGKIPLVVVDPASRAPKEVLSVSATNWRGGVQATEHLLELGHRRIAFVGAPPTSTPGGERLAGFRSAMEAAGLSIDPSRVVPGHFSPEDGRACAGLLRASDRPTAIFAASDSVALGVLQAAYEVGLRVPQDLSVIGFDDSYAAVGTTPQLTTVRQPLADMGRMAMRSTLSVLHGGTRITPHVELATTLVVRGSTAPVISDTL